MILHAHPMGNTFARELAKGLVESGLLTEHWTALDYPERETWLRWLPVSARRQMQRRRLPDEVKPFTRLRPWMELGRLFGPRLGRGDWSAHEHGRFSVDRVFHDLDRRIARRLTERKDVRGVYLYEDGAAESFAVARELGVRTFYDLPIGYWRVARRLLSEEAQLSPEWAETLEGVSDSDAKLARKDQELALADTVFVASSFTQQTLSEFPGVLPEVVVAPYGAPTPTANVSPSVRHPDDPLKVLFVGSLGQRKGLRYLLEAMDSLKGQGGFNLTLIGTLPGARCDPLRRAVRHHRYIPSLPHAEILGEMRRHHVLVLPSLFEGFGLVLTEAMANGLPIIATPHTAAPDLIENGKEGFLVPIRSTEEIATRLTELRSDETKRQGMAEAALRRSAEQTWRHYRSTISQAIGRDLSAGNSG